MPLGQRYEPLDASTFATYTAAWQKTHANWIGIDSSKITCAKNEPHYFPVCVGGYILKDRGGLSNVTCSRIQCLSDDFVSYPDANPTCLASQPDTQDYIPPPPPIDRAANGHICPVSSDDLESLLLGPHFGFDQGLPPYFTPLHVVRLNITGSIRGQGAAGECNAIIKGAKVDVWQIDPTRLTRFTNDTMRQMLFGTDYQAKFKDNFQTKTRYDDYGNVGPQTQAPAMLRDISCRGFVESNDAGEYSFQTSVPPSHGPPRYIMLQVSAPGYETLTTRVYFSQDMRLQHLTTLAGVTEDQTLAASSVNRGFVVDSDSGQQTPFDGTGWGATQGDPTFSGQQLPGMIATDPRVIKLIFKRHAMTPAQLSTGAILGHFDGRFDIVLKSKRPNADTGSGKGNNMPAMDIDGLWADPNGDLILIETNGNVFHASQYPHARSWGTVMGTLTGDTIRGVNFIGAQSTASLMKNSLKTTQDTTSVSTPPANLWSNYESTGVILQSDSFANSPKLETAVTELSIEWSSAEAGQFRWSKQFDREASGYRYLKLIITRETTPTYVPNHPDGTLIINEIRFFQNILGQQELPASDRKMTSPRQPDFQKVTCSSFVDQFHHCFRAFDGDQSSKSFWQTKAVGSSNIPITNINPSLVRSPGLTLAEPQWVLFDFGPGYYIRPSAMRIVCGASDDSGSPRGCPRTFKLLGSTDSIYWKTVTQVDMYDYAGEYANGGKLFTFFWEAPTGRPNGHKCGTCDLGPKFLCYLDAYDGTCASRYCNAFGTCDDLPVCRAGEYMDQSFTSLGQPSMECKQCAPGRYGATSGLSSSFCSGPCTAGYYCLAGSTTPTQFPCGGESVYCPRGSGLPVPAAAGRHTVFEIDQPVESASARDASASNSSLAPPHIDEALFGAVHMGHLNYLQHPIPVYNVSWNHSLSGLAGYRQYAWITLQGNPLHATTRTYQMLCQVGHYCHQGKQLPCPVGVYGDRQGLQESRCTEPCIAGEYCPAGSVTPTICEPGYYCPDGNERVPCPPGTFGRISGLKDRHCSGLCKQGYYCPAGSTSATQIICPAGRYGAYGGHGDNGCTGYCRTGYYCPAGSTNDSAVPCGGISVYCPIGSPLPVPVSRGFYSTDGQINLRESQTLSEVGFYAVNGERFPCPAGTYGALTGMTNSLLLDQHRNDSNYGNFCSGLCNPGYYCPKNSTSPTQLPCPPGRYGTTYGQIDALCQGTCPAGHYCPSGTITPIPCPAGVFGNTTGLTDSSCSTECWEGGCRPNLCQEGFYCPIGSTSPAQLECGGPGVFCPTGSPVPTVVSDGWYSVGPFPYENYNRRVSQRICPIGHYCVQGSKIPCPPGTYGATRGLSSAACSGLCHKGFYCPIGSHNTTLNRCPAGRYGSALGLYNSACSGPCQAGYHCPEASTSAMEFQCAVRTPENRTDSDLFQRVGTDTGYLSAFNNDNLQEISTAGEAIAPNANMRIVILNKPNMVYCPEGTNNPVIVLPGYYSTGNTRTTRSSQQPCPPGTYCMDGIMYDCPPGRYGLIARLQSPECSGLCAVGHYCPSASTARDTYPCPIGRYGATEGLGDSMCSGPCKRALDCPLGSTRQYPATNIIDSNIY